MNAEPPPGWIPSVGLCSLCPHARRVVSGRGSTFWMCERSQSDPRYRKYPPLPVVACPGFEQHCRPAADA